MHRNRFETVVVVSVLICTVCVTIAARPRSPNRHRGLHKLSPANNPTRKSTMLSSGKSLNKSPDASKSPQ